jgi:hypothetical protein
MEEFIPTEVLHRFGKRAVTFVNEAFWMIPPESGPAVIRVLRALGYASSAAHVWSFRDGLPQALPTHPAKRIRLRGFASDSASTAKRGVESRPQSI